jgi:Skp family chaperone for outer membrane proteins
VKNLTLAVAAALTVGALSTPALADHPEAANVSKYGVAVVDVGYVFDNHRAFTAAMNAMKAEMKQIEDSLKGQRDKIAQQEADLVKQGTQVATTSPEYRKAEEDLARAKADFNLKMNSLRKDLMTKESQVYFKTYQQVSAAVTTYARQRNIGLVLRFNGDPPNPENRGDIIKAINNPIWHQDNIDITRHVLEIVNGGPAASTAVRPQTPAGTAGPATGPTTGPGPY